MKSSQDLEFNAPKQAEKTISPSLRDDKKVNYEVEQRGDSLRMSAETDTLGVLRACNDTVFRLSMLHNKVVKR